jgi:hypothetical protein
MDVEKIYVDEKRVAQIIGCSVQTLRNDRFENRGLPYRKKGKRSIRYFLPEVYDYMDKIKIIPQTDFT